MNNLAEIFYLLEDNHTEKDITTKAALDDTIKKETELYDRLCRSLSEDQRKVLDEFYEVIAEVGALQERIVVSKAVGLGVRIASEAFLVDGGNYNG